MELKKYNFFVVYSIGMQIFLGTNNVVKYCNAMQLDSLANFIAALNKLDY